VRLKVKEHLSEKQLKKSLIRTVSELAKMCNASLNSIMLNNFALENFLHRYQLVNPKANQIVFKIGSTSIETHFFVGGRYYASFVDNMNLNAESAEIQETIVNTIRDNYKHFLNLSENLPVIESEQFQTLAYGNALTDELITKLSGDFSAELNKLEIRNYPDQLSESHNFIEALGTAL